jgi:hypothetical protein
VGVDPGAVCVFDFLGDLVRRFPVVLALMSQGFERRRDTVGRRFAGQARLELIEIHENWCAGVPVSRR